MGITIKSFFQSFNEIPEGKFPPEYYTPRLLRAMVFGNYAHSLGILTHSLFIVVFALIGVRTLAFFNFFSLILWSTGLTLHRRGYISQGYLLIAVENIAHAAVCIVVIGWDTGFQYLLLVQPVCVFVLHWRTDRKALVALIYCLAYVAMNYYANVSVPIIELSQNYIAVLNYGNIIVICLILTSLGYIYSRAAITAEDKLEHEHQKTNAALIERNQALKLLNQELADAADYVRTILPEPITEGPIRTDWRFIPSTSLGGDAFGYHMVDDNHFAIYLIDVSGHGVGAALLSVSVMNVLRSQSLPNTDFKDPEQVLEALNIAFPGEANNDMFFTILDRLYNYSKNLGNSENFEDDFTIVEVAFG